MNKWPSTHERMNQWMDEWMSEWMNEWTNERMDELIHWHEYIKKTKTANEWNTLLSLMIKILACKKTFWHEHLLYVNTFPKAACQYQPACSNHISLVVSRHTKKNMAKLNHNYSSGMEVVGWQKPVDLHIHLALKGPLTAPELAADLLSSIPCLQRGEHL